MTLIADEAVFAEIPVKKEVKAVISGIYIMENIRCPGVLIECGFLSNPQEEARLSDPEYQKKLCCVMASTLSLFLHTE